MTIYRPCVSRWQNFELSLSTNVIYAVLIMRLVYLQKNTQRLVHSKFCPTNHPHHRHAVYIFELKDSAARTIAVRATLTLSHVVRYT